MPEKPMRMEDFTPEDSKAFLKWMDNPNDWDPGHIYDALGYAPGKGGFRTREELEPGFLDELAGMAGFTTPKMKERQELFQAQQQMKPLIEKAVLTKMARMEHLRTLPETTADIPEVANTLGFNRGGTGMQPFPGGAPGQPVASTVLEPAPVGDPAMPGLPPGASSAEAAAAPQISPPDAIDAMSLPEGGRVMEPTTAQIPDVPMAGQPQQFDYQGKPVPAPAPSPMVELPIRPEPMMVANKKPLAPPPPAPRKLKEWERHQAGITLHSQATGHLVPDGKGSLVPYHPEAQLLDAPQQRELANIYSGADPSGVRLPAGQFMTALRGKQESQAQEVTPPVREYMAGKGWAKTPENIDAARQAVQRDKQRNEMEQIAYKEGLQMYSKDVNDELGAMGVKNPLNATADQIEQAIKTSIDRKISKHAQELTDTFNAGAIDQTDKDKLTGLQQIVRVTNRIRSEFTPEERREFVGKLDNPKEKLMQFFQENPRFARFDALVNREMVAAFETGGKALTAQEAAIIFGFLPTAKEWSPANFEAKLREADDYAKSKVKTIVELATSNRANLAERVDKAVSKESARPDSGQKAGPSMQFDKDKEARYQEWKRKQGK